MAHDMRVMERVLVPHGTAEAVRPLLERTEDCVHVGKETCDRYTLRGVPARLIDVLVTRRLDLSQPDADNEFFRPLVVEIGRKAGRFDGAERWRLCLRLWSSRQNQWADEQNVMHPVHVGGTLAVAAVPNAVVVTVAWADGSWVQVFPALRSDLAQYDLRKIVLWHYERYYRFLAYADAEALANSFEASHPELRTLTLAEANRLASRDLYRLARDLGWRKLTQREQTALRMDSQWVRGEEAAERAAQMGLSRQCYRTGAGQYTHEAAAGLEMRETQDGDEDAVQTSYGSVEVDQ